MKALHMIRPVAAMLIALLAASGGAADFGTYGYDGAGNITAAGADRFTYDEFGRLRSAQIVTGSTTHAQTFTYDRYGNIRSITSTGQPDQVPAVDEATNRINAPTPATNVIGVYDAAGNVVTYNAATTFRYDPLDMVTESNLSGGTGIARSVYLYNASNERIATLKVAGSTVVGAEWTLRDASAKVLRRLSKDSAGTWRWEEDYIYRDAQMLAAEVPGNTHHFHLDHLGTPRVITGNGGARISTHTYAPFGRELTSSAQDTEKKKFTGHERDADNLDYMHARYYVPFAGRFLSVDPVINFDRVMKNPQGWNRYAYVSNNPINKTDPDGRDEY
ncbi:MAG TPA: RHS repeat-associated core domain-containing protein, partial [Candidatus Synoicihabitans sp.]|nr:RHS repeat-associated core domain-containing protein [Candidatus Synoicihabitans sp.]